MEFMEYMGEKEIPFSIIFTKADKLRPQALERNIEEYKRIMLEGVWWEFPNYFVSSSSDGTGQDEILNYIEEINSNLKN